MSFVYETSLPREELLAKASAHLKAVGFKVKTMGYVIEAINGRDYSTAWCILFFLLGIVPFAIYWFTRKKNKITFDASSPNRFTITYEGTKALREAERLANMFKK